MKLIILFLTTTTIGNAATLDCDYVKKVKGQEAYDYCIQIQKKFSCEEVNEQYTVCNGNKYIREVNSSETLKREVKRVEENLENSKSPTKSEAVAK